MLRNLKVKSRVSCFLKPAWIVVNLENVLFHSTLKQKTRLLFVKPGFWSFCFVLFLFGLNWPLVAQNTTNQAPTLSNQAQISILTCGTGPILYEAFGHSAIRVTDKVQGLDVVFNYGIFDFNQPNFYGNFALGFMRYKLGFSSAEEFLYQYRYYKRSVREQVLNLDSAQKQAIIAYININLLPKNQEYFYDYFYNNCSTKIVELLDSALQHQVVWAHVEPEGKVTYRKLIHQYTVFQPWGRLGIDLGLGAIIDKPLVGKQLDFLPDGLEHDIFRALVKRDQIQVPLVIQSSILYDAPVFYGDDPFWMGPVFLFSFILLITIGLVWKSIQFPKVLLVWRSLLFVLVGMLGWVELLIWLFTNHKAAAWNYNLLWANPLLLFLGLLWPYFENRYRALKTGLAWYFAAILVLWFLLPQEMNPVLIPLVLSLMVASLPPRVKEIQSITAV